MTVPETIHLTATTPEEVHGGYSIKIIEDRTESPIAICSGTDTCTASAEVSWSENETTTERKFHAEVSSEASEERTFSSGVTVTVHPYGFSVTLTASTGAVEVPNSFTLTAKTTHSTESTPFNLSIYSDDNNELIASCGSTSECAGKVEISWYDNFGVHDLHYHAEVSTGYGLKAGESAQNIVIVLPVYIPVDLSVAFDHIESGITVDKITATPGRELGSTPYHIEIREGTGVNQVGPEENWCPSSESPCVTYLRDAPYYATVENAAGEVFGGSVLNDLNVTRLAALFPNAEAVCTALIGYVGTHLGYETPSDQLVACEAAAAAGATVAVTLAAIHATGSGPQDVMWWLLREGTLEQPGIEVPAPSGSDPDPIPNKLPEAWPVRLVAESLIDLNSEAGLSLEPAEEISERCMWQMAKVGEDGAKECETLPMFVSGSDVKEATVHDLEALAEFPERIKLNSEQGKAKEERGEKREWYKGRGGCSGSTPTGGSCDEYPFFTTQQGGPEKTPEPSLKWIPLKDNRQQGVLWAAFLKRCRMRERVATNHALIALPMPPSSNIPTIVGLCNNG